jgi:MYXO-CTERM domain-containing protein
MMTQLLMAVYPDIFKAGSAFAGVPAGCSNVFDGSGLCGLPAQTAQQWGDRVRAMFPAYTGHRPRVQLVHGDGDTVITYKNEAEAVKEWTNVLGLTVDPTVSVNSGLTLGSHQAKRRQWKDSCGWVRLDVLTSVGGDHGPSDALFQGNFVLPFLGLDSQAAVDAALDPEIVQCAGGTDGGVPGPDAGRDGGSAGSAGSGGRVGSAGGVGGSSTGSGGSGSGGAAAGGTGGNNSATGGSSVVPNTGGTAGSKSGGAAGSGGSPSGTGGTAGAPGTGGSSNGSSGSSGAPGCGCAVGASGTGPSTVIMVLALGLLAFRRKRR